MGLSLLKRSQGSPGSTWSRLGPPSTPWARAWDPPRTPLGPPGDTRGAPRNMKTHISIWKQENFITN